MEIAKLAVESIIAVVGLYLVHSFRRSQRLRIAEQRVASYRELWQLFEIARPTRKDPWDGVGPLTPAEATVLHAAMTHWYYTNGNGMLLTDQTKRLYLEAKKRLGAYSISRIGIESISSGNHLSSEGNRRISELSLLRTQMKLDLDIYGVFYEQTLAHEDEAFLRSAMLDPNRWVARPWQDQLARAGAWVGWRVRRAAPELYGHARAFRRRFVKPKPTKSKEARPFPS